jgi:hypothetical protein
LRKIDSPHPLEKTVVRSSLENFKEYSPSRKELIDEKDMEENSKKNNKMKE